MLDTRLDILVDRAEQQFFGKYRGIVEDNKDPQKLGRLRVRVASVLTASPESIDSDDTITDWAMPCVPYGGAADQGFFVIPERGAHVWVEFEEGRLDHPIWTGTFWVSPNEAAQTPTQGQDTAGTEEDLEPKRRVWKSSSGHVLEFSDIGGKEAIHIVHKSGSLLNFDEKGNVFLYSKEGSLLYLNAELGEVTLAHQNGAHLTMKGDQVSITNKDGSSVSLMGESVQVNATNVHIRSQTVTLGEGAVEPAILGQAFAAIFDTHTHLCTAPGSPSSPPVPPQILSIPMSPAISQCVKVK